MTLLDLLKTPWAIEPAKLHELQGIYATHLRGEKIDIKGIEAQLGRPLDNQTTEYTVQAGGVAVLVLDGVIAPKANLFSLISGGVSAQIAEQAVLDALDDPNVRSLMLVVDSPGGNVHGVPEVSAAVRRFAAQKPAVALATGSMCSAAYWIGSAANAVYVSGSTATLGSIGVVATHDYEPRGGGRVVTEITAGKYKRMASSNEPLTAEGREYLQAQADYLYSVFVDTVAENRRVSTDMVLEHMADGRLFYGQQAIDAGLADGVSAFDQLLDALAAHPEQFAKRRQARVQLQPQSVAGDATKPAKGAAMADKDLTRESFERDHATLYAEMRAEFIAQGAAQERDRIKGVRAQGLPGHEELIERLAMDGQTTPEQAAMAVLEAQRKAMSVKAAELDADAPAPAAASAAPANEAPTREQKAQKAKAYAAANKVSFVDAYKALGFDAD